RDHSFDLGGFAWYYTHAYIEDGVTFIAISSLTFLAKGIAPVAIIDRQLPFEYTITSRSTDVVVMTHPVQNINHSAFRSMFEREKLSGNNFNDWFRQLKLVLRVEKKMFVIEQPLPAAPAANSKAQVLLEWNAVYDAYNELKAMFEKQAGVERFELIQTFHACKQEEGKPVAAYVIQMKGYVDQLECLGYVLPHEIIVGLILNGLTKDFSGFVRNYNMHNIGKTIGELHDMLIEYEKGLPKKAETPQVMMIKGGKIQKANKKSLKVKGKGKANVKGKDKQVYIPKPKNPKPSSKEHPTKDDACHHYKEVGHWKRNCPMYLAELLKKKKEARKLKQRALYLYVGNGVRAQVEAIGSFDLVFPNGLLILIMEYLVNISKRRAFWSLNGDILKIYDSDYQYAVSIKEDTACIQQKDNAKGGDDEVIFDVDQSIKRPPIKDDECYRIDDLDDTININTPYSVVQETTEPTKLVREHLYSASANEIEEKKTELKDLPNHLEYAYMHGDKSFPIIILSELSDIEKSSLLQVLEKRKGAIAWKMSDIKGTSPSHSTHKILMEDDYKPVIQPQRRLNPKVQDVKGGITVVLNDNNELIPSRTVTGWRVCIDYRKLNDATRKDHFYLPFIDMILERLCRNKYYYFLDGFSGFFQIPIAPEDQEKITFAYPYRTFAYQRMPFGLCNAPATFQRCMTAIFHDMVKDFMELFMDDFLVFAVLGERIEGKFKPIYYASKTLNNAQEHYTTTEKELLAVDAKPRLIRWVLLLQGSRLENPELSTFAVEEIGDEFPDEHLMALNGLKPEINNDEPWYADYVNYLIRKIVTTNWTPEKRRRIFSQVKNYFWDEPYAFKLCPDNIMRRCVTGNEISRILPHCHLDQLRAILVLL
ncbi:reverse transcriptase domain-containing protein, partial [Tanacetum coccineum]